jgi:hypothetical protein
VADAQGTGPLAVDLSGLYFVTEDGGIVRLPLKGGECLPFAAPGEHGRTDAFAVDEFAVIRAAGARLYRVPKGGDPEALIATERAPIKAIAVADGAVLLALADGAIVRHTAAKDEVLARGQPGDGASGLALHGGYAYWATAAGVARVPLK